MTPQEIRDAITGDPALQALVPDTVALAAHATFADLKRIESRFVTERGVRALAVLPRSRHALLQTLKDAESAPPAWFVPVMTAAAVPVEDQPAYLDDISAAWRWLTQEGGIDIGSGAARAMLDMIAAGVPAAASACVAVKALAEAPAPVTEFEIRCAIIADDGTLRV